MVNEKTIVITDDEGNEKEMEILFTFDHEVSNRSYVLYTDPEDDQGEVYASKYNEGVLEEVTDEKEFAMIEEVFNTYLEEFYIDEE